MFNSVILVMHRHSTHPLEPLIIRISELGPSRGKRCTIPKNDNVRMDFSLKLGSSVKTAHEVTYTDACDYPVPAH